MSAGNRKLRSFANRLLELSKTDGLIDSSKVTAVIETLKRTNRHGLKETLEIYRDLIREDIRQSTAKITYAGTISESSQTTLLKSLENRAGRKLTLELKEDPSLIAGIKVRVGDSVFEHSIQRMLSQISQVR